MKTVHAILTAASLLAVAAIAYGAYLMRSMF